MIKRTFLLALIVIAITMPAHSNEHHAEFVPGEILVRFREVSAVAQKNESVELLVATAADGRQIPLRVEPFDGSNLVKGLRLARVEARDTLDAIDALRRRPDVLYAEPNYVRHVTRTPNDPMFPDQWALKNTGQVGRNDYTGRDVPGTIGADIDAEAAWDVTTGSSEIVVGVIDTGIDINHADLKDNIWVNPGEIANDNIDNDSNGFVDDVNGWDFHNNDKTVFDSSSNDDHGTHVAGTIGAKGNNGLGVAGINWDVRILPMKVIGPRGGNDANIVNAYAYVKALRDRGVNVRVLNNSYGGPGKSQAALDAIRALNEAGFLFVAGAGNAASDNFAFPQYPSNYDVPNILGVAATDRFDQLAVFSNFSARMVSMGAPGRSIRSTVSNNGYAIFSGTSMSSPHAAGVAALALAVNPALTAQQLRGVVAFTGDIVPMLNETTTTGRRGNAARAVQSALENDSTAPASAANFRITAQNGRSIALSWTAPGDDGNVGTAADYDVFFVYPTTGDKILLPTFVYPATAGTTQTTVVHVPFRNFSGAIELRTYDNAGNFSSATLPVTIAVATGSDPYIVTMTEPAALTTGGTPLTLKGDDRYRRDYALPFAFPFFGALYSSVTVSINGALYFSLPPVREAPAGSPEEIGADAGSSVEGLTGQKMIAAMWDDLRTDRGTGDIFVVQPTPNTIIFRWEGVTFDTPLSGTETRGENPINFEVELRSDGTIISRYGTGQSAPINTRLTPVVGVSGGEPDAYVVESHTSETTLINLTNAQTVVFAPRASTPSGAGRRRGVGRGD